MIALFVTAALFLVVGYATSLLLPRSSGGTLVDQLGVSYLVGMAASGLVLFALTLLGAPFNRGLVAALAAVAALVIIIRRPRRNSVGIASSGYPVTPTLLMALPVLILLGSSYLIPLADYDGRAFWLLKARAIAHERSISGEFFRGGAGYDPRNRYPLLVPLDAAAVYAVIGNDDDQNARWLFAFGGISFLLLLRHELGKRFSAATGAWLAALVAWTPQILLASEGSALSAYADVTLGAFSAAAFLAMTEGEWPAFGFWLAAVVLTKNEGLAIAAILVVLSLAADSQRRQAKRFVISLALPLIATIALLVWQQTIPPGDEHNLPRLMLALPSHLDRLPAAAASFARRWFDLEQWGVFWPAFLIAALLVPRRPRIAAVVAAMVFCAALTVVYISTYAVSPWRVDELAAASATRLLLHMTGPAALVIAAAAHKWEVQ